MNRPVHAFLLATSILTAACAGGATATAPTDGSSPATSPAAASLSPSIAEASPSTAASAVAGGDGAALCAFLQSEIPALQKAGSTGGAISVLAIDYSNWLAADSSRVLPDAAAMDTLTTASCPSIRTDILKILGEDSFANSL